VVSEKCLFSDMSSNATMMGNPGADEEIVRYIGERVLSRQMEHSIR